MAQPSIIVFSASDVDKVPMLADSNVFTGTNEFDGTTNFDGATDFDGTNTFDGATVLNGALTGTSVKDEDNMVSDSATAVPTQQSVKAYADTKALALGADDNYVTDTMLTNLTSGTGVTGTFTTVDLKTVTVTNGIITGIV